MNKKNKIKENNNDEIYQNKKIPCILAAIASLFIPGLGQFLSRSFRRGILLLFSFISIGGLLLWRFQLAARYDTGIVNIVSKAIHLQPFFIFLVILFIIFYVWIVIDAYLVAANRGAFNPLALFFLVMVIFFALGWQIGEIDPYAVVTQADDAAPALMRVLWPWEKAITYPEELLIAKAKIQTPCTEIPFPENQVQGDEPYIHLYPTCGMPTSEDGTAGTTFHISGKNLTPQVEADIWWKDPIGNEFRQRQAGEYIKVIPDDNGEFEIDIVMPYRLLPPSSSDVEQVWEIQTRQLASVGKAELSSELKLAVEKIIETIFIGMMATFFGIILALPISFLAARNLMSASAFTMGIYYLTRTFMNIVRSIEPLIWAIIAVIVVGLGPFAGILALTLHSMAALGKLYSESIESIDPGPIEAIQATGANWIQTIMYAVVPQVIPPFVSFTIYRWDINIRMSTIIGFVGGGGIGFLLAQWIRLLDYKSAGIAVWFIAITVAILDYVSSEIRARYV